MAKDYWIETLPSGRQRFVKSANAPSLRRAQSDPHDGSSQSSRSRRVDFLDVTREEYNTLLVRERALNQENEELRRKNSALRANWRTCDDELRRVHSRVPSLEDAVRNLEYENRELRRGFDDHHHHHHHRGGRERDEVRRLRNKNTKLRNDNDTLAARIRSLERDIREGVGDRARRLMEELNAWRRRYEALDIAMEKLQHKLDYATSRNKILESDNEYLVRQEMKYKGEVTRLDAILRHHGLSVSR
ncbi:hypothetical protein VP1G_05911 [Cytospora mali]|uniref:Uncharacterized protein n=1 Tax=Cytospora mali TaxID=578113 RepID=A0A194V478_CYTMA|nr:hypothetical protein VP1G_05911 [Valsa mali var. pyri (nom. inval.)]